MAVSDRAALMAAIRDQPDEDTPRLAFADWLDERGDAYFADWAALIRAQVEAAGLERFSPRWLELARVQHRLFEKRAREWDNASGSRFGPHAFRRGFREAVPVYATPPRRRIDLLFSGNPVRALRLMHLDHREARTLTAELVESPHLERLEALDLGDNPFRHARRFLQDAGHRLPRLRALGLSNTGIRTDQLLGLLRSPAADKVTALDLHANQFGAGFAAAFAESPSFPRLTWLDLSECGIDTPDLAWFTATGMPRLRVLNLARDALGQLPAIGPDGVSFLDSLGAPDLQYLDLSNHEIGTEGAERLADSLLLLGLRELKLGYNRIGPAGVEALAASPNARHLRRLDLSGNPFGDAAAEALLASPHLVSVGMLGLVGCGQLSPDTRQQLRERFAVVTRDEWDPFVRFLEDSGPTP